MAQLKIGIWGYGKEGKANYKYAQNEYPDADITILNDTEIEAPNNARTLIGDPAKQAIASGTFNIIIKSPGISLYRQEAQDALEAGTKITSATNIWLSKHPEARTLIVTGTKGKSTTVSLIAHLLKSMGKDIMLAGNIGTALLEQTPARDLNIIELSSYQIADLTQAPNYALFLNLFPEHLGWHKTHENYFKDKLRLLTISDKTQNIIFKNNSNINERYEFSHKDITFDEDNLKNYISPLQGHHNQVNIAAALQAIEALGYSKQEAEKHLQTYKPLPHRQEIIPSTDGKIYINDSIATIPEASLEALKIYQGKPITLLLGGEERGQNYQELIAYLKDNTNINMILLPENGKRIEQELKKLNCHNKFEFVDHFQDAIKHAQKITPQNGIIILSPAAPSYGHFRNFEDRGNQFKKFVQHKTHEN